MGNCLTESGFEIELANKWGEDLIKHTMGVVHPSKAAGD